MVECLLKELGPELNVQYWISNVCLGRVEDAWTKCFAIRQVYEKYLANGKDVFWEFMDLEKAYDTIDWQKLLEQRIVFM